MKLNKILILTSLMVSSIMVLVRAQKSVLGNDSYKSWISLGEYGISNNGRFLWFNSVLGDWGNVITVMSTDKSLRKEFKGGYNLMFTNDSKFAVVQLPNDSLAVIDMKKLRTRYLLNAKRAKIFQFKGAQILTWISNSHLQVENLKTGRRFQIKNIIDYSVNASGSTLLIRKENALFIYNVQNEGVKEVYNGEYLNPIFNNAGDAIAFFVKENGNNNIWLYSSVTSNAVCWIKNPCPAIKKGLIISDNRIEFSENDKYLYFDLTWIPDSNKKSAPNKIADQPDIWHYRDKFLMSSQIESAKEVTYYRAVCSTSIKSKIRQLEDDNSMVIAGMDKKNNYLIITARNNEAESYWDKSQVSTYKLFSLNDGTSRSLSNTSGRIAHYKLSPKERYAIWPDTGSINLVCYDIKTQQRRNLTQEIHTILNKQGHKLSSFLDLNICGWGANDDFAIVSDGYDLWQVDLQGINSVINLTAGYGRNKRIRFRPYEDQIYNLISGKEIVIVAMDSMYNNGVGKCLIGKSEKPKMGMMMNDLMSFNGAGGKLIKARDAEVYLISKQNVSISPNLYVTRNFITFNKLSNIEPEKKFNWLSSELITWTMYDGTIGKGILYKPDNFDASKKYPIIFNYYARRSHELHKFQKPAIAPNQLSIPWYVSNGYLVFIPDIINDKKGHVSSNIVNSVESAAKFLIKTYSFIDQKRMGLQGHSFGGYATNVLICNSDLFAAAQSSAGVADLVSRVGGTSFGENEQYSFVEIGQYNFGAGVTPWASPVTYIQNSPVFYADKVKTPVLIIHGRNDGVVKFSQAVEFFTALRRAKKKVWILGYSNDHVLPDWNQVGLDVMIRQQQFFDHYLKDKPAPLWMVEGIPAKYKGIKSGLQLDSLNRTP